MFRVFRRIRRLSPVDSSIYRDSIDLQVHYLRLRDEICLRPNSIRSSALIFTEKHLREQIENENRPVKIGDFVYVSRPSMIVFIESIDDEFVNGIRFFRPKKRNFPHEVFLGEKIEKISRKFLRTFCHVVHLDDYRKFQFDIDETDLFICESRYNCKTKKLQPIESFDVPKNENIRFFPREQLLQMSDVQNRFSTSKTTFPLQSVIFSSNCFYKCGDFVYVNFNSNEKSILKIDRLTRSDSDE